MDLSDQDEVERINGSRRRGQRDDEDGDQSLSQKYEQGREKEEKKKKRKKRIVAIVSVEIPQPLHATQGPKAPPSSSLSGLHFITHLTLNTSHKPPQQTQTRKRKKMGNHYSSESFEEASPLRFHSSCPSSSPDRKNPSLGRPSRDLDHFSTSSNARLHRSLADNSSTN